MKTTSISVFLFIFVLAGASPVSAAPGPAYFGADLLSFSYDADGLPKDAESETVQFTLGRQLHENLSIEARFATGGSDEMTVPVFVSGAGIVNVDLDVELDQVISVLIRPHTSGEEVRAYGLIGVSRGELTARASAGGVAVSESESDTSVTYGFGAEVQVSDRVWLKAEYASLLSDDDYDFDATSLGVRLEF